MAEGAGNNPDNETEDWVKSLKMLGFLETTQNDVTGPAAGDKQAGYWWIDAAFVVCPDFKSHTGANFWATFVQFLQTETQHFFIDRG